MGNMLDAHLKAQGKTVVHAHTKEQLDRLDADLRAKTQEERLATIIFVDTTDVD